MEYETMCVLPSQLEEMAETDPPRARDKKRKKDKSSSSELDIENYTCGCCDPILEGESYPSFCGGQICAESPTPCNIDPRRALKKEDSKKKKKKKVKATNVKKKKTKKTREPAPIPGVTICLDGETLCVDELDPDYLGTAYTCGPCAA